MVEPHPARRRAASGEPASAGPSPAQPYPAWLSRYAVFVAAATLCLIFAGGLVTSTGSGLSVPDWPLSYGQLFPRMVGGIVFEHGHRLVAGTVVLLTLALVIAIWRKDPRRAVRRVALAAIGAILAQAILGGLTVLLLLPKAISIAHAGLAEIFFSLTISLAVLVSRGWRDAPQRRTAGGPVPLPLAAAITVGVIYGQILLGAVARHFKAGLAIPDFPLSFGRLVPPSLTGLVALNFAHRVGAVVVALFCVADLWLVLKHYRHDRWLVRPAGLLVMLVATQIVLGGLTVWSAKAVIPTTLHVAVGASILATSVVLTLRAFRLYRLPQSRPETVPVPQGVTA